VDLVHIGDHVRLIGVVLGQEDPDVTLPGLVEGFEGVDDLRATKREKKKKKGFKKQKKRREKQIQTF